MFSSLTLNLLKRAATRTLVPQTPSKDIKRASTFWKTPTFSTATKMSSIGGAGIGTVLYAIVSNPAQLATVPEEAKEKRHHLKNGQGFTNPWDSYVEVGMWQLLIKGMWWRKITGQANQPDTTPPTVPIRTPSFGSSRETPKLRSTWLGHACYYIEFPSGFRVLFDPVFEDCCAPIHIKSLKRYTPPPCEIDDLPMIDAVVISHNHYDHLSYPTIQRIKEKFPEAHFFAPLGNKTWFEKSGIQNVTELDWWESRDMTLQRRNDEVKQAGSTVVNNIEELDKARVTATIGALPCQHISARGPFDKCKTLWASWAVESGGAKVYFAGDTGYRTVPSSVPTDVDDYSTEYESLPTCPAFAQIGVHRGPFDLGLIPIGAYEPRWMFSNVHANPKDAVNIFIDTKCKNALGMHWGTWVLTEEEVLAPPKELEKALKWKGIARGKFDVCDIGESREFMSSEQA